MNYRRSYIRPMPIYTSDENYYPSYKPSGAYREYQSKERISRPAQQTFANRYTFDKNPLARSHDVTKDRMSLAELDTNQSIENERRAPANNERNRPLTTRSTRRKALQDQSQRQMLKPAQSEVQTLPQRENYFRQSSRQDLSQSVGSSSLSPVRKSADFSRSVRQVSSQVSKELPSQLVTQADDAHSDHLFHTFQSLKLVNSLPEMDTELIRGKTVFLARKREHLNRKTVIFDLDETLVHCNKGSNKIADVQIPIRLDSGEKFVAGINIRPYARECLIEASKTFEVIVFTASAQCYADAVLDYLDPRRELITHRLYRQHCIKFNDVYIKDLRIFANRKISDIIIIDNLAHSFAYQLDNGIPIISWYDDRNDKELYNLISYLKALGSMKDPRLINRHTFKLYSFYEDFRSKFENK